MRIGGFQKLSTVDYPGHLCSTIFLAGCNLRCKFCHNPSLVHNNQGEGKISLEDVMSYLEKRQGLIDAVCVTGGEPTLNKGLEAMIEKIKGMGYKIKLDTNGTNPHVIGSLLEKELINYIAVDIKAPEEKYEEVAGCWVNTKKIKETIELVLNSNIDYEFRTTFLPDLDEKDIHKIAESLSGSKRYVVQQFRNNTTLDQEYSSRNPYNSQFIFNVVNGIKGKFANCEVRGVQ